MVDVVATPDDIVRFTDNLASQILVLNGEVNASIYPRINARTSTFPKTDWVEFIRNFADWKTANADAFVQRLFPVVSGYMAELKEFGNRYNAFRQLVINEVGTTQAREIDVDTGILDTLMEIIPPAIDRAVQAAGDAAEGGKTAVILVCIGLGGFLGYKLLR